MNFIISVAILVVGIILLVSGYTAVDSLKDQFSRAFTGHLTDKTLWMLILGGVCCVIGLSGIYYGRRAQ